MARYQVYTRCAAAPKSGGGKYRRPVHIRVIDTTKSEWHAVRGLNDGIKFEASNVDSRYDGPRSAYGKAMAEAKRIAKKLNEKETIAALSSACL